MNSLNKKLLAAALLSLLASTSFSKKSAAAESVCFTQPNGLVPVACPAKPDGTPIISSGAASATTTDASSIITLGATFQTIAAANATRNSLEFGNICSAAGNCTNTTDMCYLHIGADAATVANSIQVPPGSQYLRVQGTIPSDAIQATCDNTNDKFYLKVQ